MSGFIGAVAEQTTQILIKGVTRLDYLTYHLCGISMVKNHELETVQIIGKLTNLLSVIRKSLSTLIDHQIISLHKEIFLKILRQS